MFYADSNLFIYGATDEGAIGEESKRIIESIKNGEFKAFTSTLTIDEFLWRVQKEVGREFAAESVKIFFTIQNLEIINVDQKIILNAIEVYKINKLDPRDAIHLAAMRSKKINKIFSSDSDFDKIKDIKRIDFTKVKHIQSNENGTKE